MSRLGAMTLRTHRFRARTVTISTSMPSIPISKRVTPVDGLASPGGTIARLDGKTVRYDWYEED